MAVFGFLHQPVLASGARFRARRWGAAIAAFGLVCAGLPTAEAANFTCSWNDATASWTTVSDWSNCNSTFPNNGSGNTFDATIATGDPTLTTAITIGSVTITSPGAWSIAGTGSATLTGGVTNSGALDVNINGGDGGGNLTVGGTLANTGTVQAGPNNGTLGAATTVTLGGLSNPSGASFEVFGSASHSATLAFSSGGTGFTSNGGTFVLFDTTPLTLPGAFTNSGTYALEGTAAVTVTGGFTNSGALDVNINGGDGGGNLTVGGTLANTGTVQAGPNNGTLGAATTVTLGGLNNGSTGTIDVLGSATQQAALNIVAASGTTANNAGTMALLEHAALNSSTGVNLANSGVLDIDIDTGGGGSTATIGGTLSNTSMLNIGNTALTAPTTVTAAGFTNSGTVNLLGNTTAGSTNKATVTVNGQASNSGTINIPTATSVTVTGAGNAYTQTAGFTSLSGGTLAAPNVNITGGALQGLGTVTGALSISGTGTIQAINLANNALPATLTIDGNYAQSGGTFNELLHGTGTQIDVVSVGNGDSVNLTGGNLQVSGVTFALGQMFNDIMTFQPNELTGTFATLQGGGNGNMVNLGGGLTLEALYNNAQGNISLEVVGTVTGKIWNDGTGNWTTDPNKWTAPGAPQPTDDVIIGMTTNGNVTLNNDSTIDSLHMTVGNLLTVDTGSTLSVAAAPTNGANGGNSVSLDGGSTITLGGTLNTGGSVLVNSGATLGLSGGTIMGSTLAGPGTIQTNPNQIGTLQSVTISAGATFAGQTGSTTTLAGTMVNNGTLDAAGGTINATTGFNGTGKAQIDPGGTMIIGANSTVGTLTHNGTGPASLSLGGNNVTVSADYNNANFGTGNSFNKLANVATTGGQILAAGPNPANLQVITGASITGGNTTTPTLNLGIVHVGDSATYQIANEGSAANPSLRGAIQTDVNGGNITGSLLTGTGVTAANFGPIAPGGSTTTYTVTAAGPGSLAGQAVHIANNFGNVPEQTVSFSAGSQINLFAALAFLKEGGQGSLSGGGTSFDLDFGNVPQGSSQDAMLAILNDNPLADQAFTDLLSTDGDGSMGPFSLTGCSVSDLPGGVSQGGCDASFDTSDLGNFQDAFSFPVESSNSSGYDQVIGDVTLTLEGSIGPVTSTPEPGSITVLASGLGVLLLVVRRRRRTGSGPCSGGRLYRPVPRRSLGSERD
jgi:hypothetical protein